MTKQKLNSPQIGAGFEEMDCERVSQRMRRDRFEVRLGPGSAARQQRRFATRQPQQGSDARRAIRVARSAGG